MRTFALTLSLFKILLSEVPAKGVGDGNLSVAIYTHLSLDSGSTAPSHSSLLLLSRHGRRFSNIQGTAHMFLMLWSQAADNVRLKTLFWLTVHQFSRAGKVCSFSRAACFPWLVDRKTKIRLPYPLFREGHPLSIALVQAIPFAFPISFLAFSSPITSLLSEAHSVPYETETDMAS